jgi:hypothetical protein
MSYISSNANRFYCGIESSYGQVPAIAAANRFAAVKLTARQQIDVANRKDKTGSRTYPGAAAGGRRKTQFDLKNYLSAWTTGAAPAYGPLFQAALGAAPLSFTGGAAGTSSSASQITFAAAHGLAVNQAVSCAGEIRFVASVVDAMTVLLNAPLSAIPAAGATMAPTVTYLPGTELPSVSIFDYWDPIAAVQRVLNGAAIDKLSLNINGDYHEFEFQGLAQDIIDSASFAPGEGELTAFPVEPALGNFTQTAIPGNLGQAWLGSSMLQFMTVTKAQVNIDNDLDARTHEFGTSIPIAISPGPRLVGMDLELFEQTDSATAELYQAARQRSPISVMLQLGEAAGQLCGVYMTSVIPEVPEFEDNERRLQWRFQKSRAQGTVNDEIAVAFA